MPRPTDRSRWRPTPDTAIALLALTVAAGGGGYAVASVTAGPQVFACLDAASGQPTRIATSGACAPGQTQLAWDQSGPQGPQGPQGPAGKDAVPQIVVAGPTVRHTRYARTFTLTATVPGAGWYQLHGHAEWRRVLLGRDIALHCSINRLTSFRTLDTYNVTIPAGDPFGTGTVEEDAYLQVPAAADPGPGGVTQPTVPVTVSFKCTAVSATAAQRTALTFQDPTLTITPFVMR